MIIAENIYWLAREPGVAKRIELRNSESGVVGILNESASTQIEIAVPISSVREITDRDALFPVPLVGIEHIKNPLDMFLFQLKNLKGRIEDDYIFCPYTVTPINSGSFRSGTKSYNLFRDCFMVWFLRRTQRNRMIIKGTIVNQKGWELGTF